MRRFNKIIKFKEEQRITPDPLALRDINRKIAELELVILPQARNNKQAKEFEKKLAELWERKRRLTKNVEGV